MSVLLEFPNKYVVDGTASGRETGVDHSRDTQCWSEGPPTFGEEHRGPIVRRSDGAGVRRRGGYSYG